MTRTTTSIAARRDAATYVDEFPSAAPDSNWAAAAWEMEPVGTFDEYWIAFCDAVERLSR